MIEFIYAEDLKKKYQVKGRFYILKNNCLKMNCRSLLTITDKKLVNNKKLLVVMLNPGSSQPLDNTYLETEITIPKIDELNNISLVEAKPDITQYQIMRVMSELNFSHADIINLYDFREPKSKVLFDKVNNGIVSNESSIFSDKRKLELNSYFSSNPTVILAWGNITPIRNNEEQQIIKRILEYNCLTYSVLNTKHVHLICHPSPQNLKLKQSWLNNICEQLIKC